MRHNQCKISRNQPLKEVHFTFQAEAVFRPYHASNFSGVTQTWHVTIPQYVPNWVQVWSKSGSNEGQFTLEAETVFRPYLASHCSGVTINSEMILPHHAPDPMQEHFTLEAKTVFCPYLASHSPGVNETRHVTIPSYTQNRVQVGRNRSAMNVNLLLRPK
jgi:hypothetical protein